MGFFKRVPKSEKPVYEEVYKPDWIIPTIDAPPVYTPKLLELLARLETDAQQPDPIAGKPEVPSQEWPQ